MNIETSFIKYVAQRHFIKLLILSPYLNKYWQIQDKGYYLIHHSTNNPDIKKLKSLKKYFKKFKGQKKKDLIIIINNNCYFITVRARYLDLAFEKEIKSI